MCPICLPTGANSLPSYNMRHGACCRILFTLVVVFVSSLVAESTLRMTSPFGRGRCPNESLATVVIVGVRSTIDCGIRCMRLSSPTPDGGSRCVEYSHRHDDRTCALFTNTTSSSTYNLEKNCIHFTVCTTVKLPFDPFIDHQLAKQYIIHH